MLTDNDRNFATVIDDDTLVIDFRLNKAALSAQAGQCRAMGVRHVFADMIDGDSLIQQVAVKREYGDHLNVYHVASIAKKMWVVSRRDLFLDQTHALVREYLNQQIPSIRRHLEE